MKQTTMAWLSEIYNLILHPGTRQWEREQLVQAKIHWKLSWRSNKSRQTRKRIVK
ncbi:bacteriocin immunity protein [Enterococcus casseliflavus]|nr:bacteriocin immunity protein [Enterococcus casseliflavus]